MNNLTDQQLLREYAEARRESAFAELVDRHVDLVYSAAMRMLGDTHLAEDVTQGVFVALAGNAQQLAGHPVLSGWLHCTTRNLAANAVRSDVRRRRREQEAATMNELLSADPDSSWEKISPHLDAALGELNETDRDALILRYFEKKSAAEMAGILGVSDEAAQKRVNRAVERLRALFARRGVSIGFGGLAVAISANAIKAAPIGLAGSVSAAALGGTLSTATTIVAATKTITMTALQKSIIGATMAIAVGTGLFETHQAAQLWKQNQVLQQQKALLAGQMSQLQKERDAVSNQVAALQAMKTQVKTDSDQAELLKLRGEVAQLKAANNDAMDAAAKSWLDKANRLRQRLEDTPDARIPEFQYLTDDDWLDVAKNPLDTDADYRRAFAQLRSAAENRFVSSALKPALDSFSRANDGKFPTDLAQLTQYFGSGVDDSVLQRWEVVPASVVPNIGVGEPIVTEKSAVDDLLDSRMAVGPRGYGSADWLQSETSDLLKPVYKAYVSASGGNWNAFDISQLLPYATTPGQQEAVKKLIAQKALRN